jgi:hypothetical protein
VYIFHVSTVAEISNAIEKLSLKDQLELLHALPERLKISPEDLAWTKAAEGSFAFWNNPDDAIYDMHLLKGTSRRESCEV